MTPLKSTAASDPALNDTALSAPVSVGFWQAFAFWLKLGFISFGGPAGQIAIMHQELVERRRWISESRFMHALNYCMLLPGPEAQQLATYIGWLMHRTKGGVMAGLLFILPSLLILIGLSWVYVAFGDLPVVAGVFYGIKPAVTAIVLFAAYRIGRRVLKNAVLCGIAVASFVAIFAFKLPFPLIVFAAAMIGYIGGRLAPDLFATKESEGLESESVLLGEQSSAESHTHFRWSRLLLVICSGALLWLVPMASLVAVFGWEHSLTQMAWFFTKAALLTFGGAYAVLPYVFQGAVMHYQWLTPTQMVDGLALGETTPGPLIMVVAFVGFLGGYANAVFGPEALFLAGAVAAGLVSWFTFLPSFLFILIGGPLVESTRGNLNFSAPLTAITAAVVGVIVNLAMIFGYYLLWPEGFEGGVEWMPAVTATIAFIALFYFKRSILEVIFACATFGLAFYLLT